MPYLILVFSIVLLLALPARADETVTFGNFTENGTRRYDYNQVLLVIRAEVAKQPVRVQLDYFDKPIGYRRLWLNAGQAQLVANREIRLAFQPSLILDNRGNYWLGGFVDLEFPKAKLWLTQKSFLPGLGNPTGKHITFAGWDAHSNFGLMYYRYTEKGYSPDSYLGPKIIMGPAYIWVAPSLNRPGAWAMNAQASIRF